MISCVMSVYDEPNWMVERSIRSIINQTYKVDEIIIVCDNPQNETIISFVSEFVKKVENKIVFIINKENKGLAYSLNRGISEAQNELICRMDADDEALPNRIAESIDLLQAHKLDIVTTQICVVDEKGERKEQQRDLPCSEKAIKSISKYAPCVFHPTWLFRKKVWEEIGGYREAMVSAQDYDFILRAIKMGFHIESVNSKLLNYTERAGSISGKKTSMQLFLAIYAQDNVLRNVCFSDTIANDIRAGMCDDYNRFAPAIDRFLKAKTKGEKIKATIIGFLSSRFFRRQILNTVYQIILRKHYLKIESRDKI